VAQRNSPYKAAGVNLIVTLLVLAAAAVSILVIVVKTLNLGG